MSSDTTRDTLAVAANITAQSDNHSDVHASERCCAVLAYLRAHSGTATVDDLCAFIAASASHSQQRETIAIDLYHNVLPRLSDHDLIDYSTGDEQLTLLI
jgi:hypothetical protein